MQISDEMVRAALKQAPRFWRDYNSSADQMRDALEAALAVMWRPIDEAPDDQEVLVCGYGTAGFYVTTAKKIGGDWMLFVPDDDDFTAESFGHTHFMPFPSPPNISARSSAGSEQPPSKRQVAGSNPAERATPAPSPREAT